MILASISSLAISNASVALDAEGDHKSEATSPKQGKYALLVGINKYKVRPLNGCTNDVTDFRNALVSAFNFKDDSDHIVSLLDEAATKKSILESFRTQLIEKAKKDPDGLFVFQFSGHGIQVKDDASNPDEADGLDEALVPFDVNGKVFKSPDQLRASLIIDDELSVLLNALCKETKNVIVIADCCHSGTNTRSVSNTARRLTSQDFGLKNPEAETRQDSKNAFAVDFDNSLNADRYVAISGSDASHEACESFEITKNIDRHNGMMTHHLIALLKTGRSDITYRQLSDRLRAVVSKESAQNPQIEGDLDRFVFANHGDKADPYFTVQSCDGNTATLKAGSSLGIQKGSIISFYASSAKQLRGDNDLLASGTVTEVNPFDCQVELASGQKMNEVAQSKAVISALDSATQHTIVAVSKKRPKTLSESQWSAFLKSLSSSMGATGILKLLPMADEIAAGKANSFNLAIVPGTLSEFKAAGGLTKDTKNTPADMGLYLCRANMQPVAYTWVPTTIAATDLGSKLADKSKVLAKQDTVRMIFNDTSKLNGQIDTVLWRVEQNKVTKAWEKKDCLSETTGTPHVKVGDAIVVSVTNNATIPLYVSMVSIASSGRIIPIYPRASGAEEQLMPGKTVDLTRCIVGEPLGQETFKIVAGTRPVKLDVLKMDGLMANERSISSGPQLEQILLRAAGAKTREVPSLTSFDQDWTASNLNFQIE